MNALVAYDSLFGNTEKLATAIYDQLSTKYSTKIKKVSDLTLEDLKSIELLVFGTPTHGGWFTDNIKNFLKNTNKKSFKEIRVATFDTSIPQEGHGFITKRLIKVFGNAAPRLLNALVKRGGVKIESQTFWVTGKEGPLKEGSIEEASKWASSF